MLLERNNGFEVKPMSMNDISFYSSITWEVARQKNFVNADGWVDIVGLMENGGILDTDVGCGLSIVDDKALPNAYAMTFADGSIQVRESVYNAACDGDARSRFTLAHELGHVLMHKKQIGMARAINASTKLYCDSEWQANEFAGRLLLPDEELKNVIGKQGADEIAKTYGVSYECASIRIDKFKKKTRMLRQ